MLAVNPGTTIRDKDAPRLKAWSDEEDSKTPSSNQPLLLNALKTSD
jgi:hypothetical protein